MATGPRFPNALTLVIFALATTLGGSNFLAVRFSNRELPPFWGAGLRFSTAALLFIVLALALRLTWPRGRQLAAIGMYGALAFAFSYGLMYWALVRVAAGAATVVLAMVPLATVLLTAAQRLERLRLRAVLGAVVALGGIAWMTFGPQRAAVPLDALLAMLAATFCIAQSIIFAKRVSSVAHPAVINGVGMAVGSVLLLALSAAVGEPWALPRQTASLLAVVYLVTFGSVGLFVCVLLLVRRWTASASSYMFVLFPVVTLALGAALAGEPVTREAVIGAALVMAGVWFGALSPAARRAASAPPPAPRQPTSPALDES